MRPNFEPWYFILFSLFQVHGSLELLCLLLLGLELLMRLNFEPWYFILFSLFQVHGSLELLCLLLLGLELLMRLNFEPCYFILFVPVSGARVVGAAVSSPPGAGAPHEA